MTSEPEFIAEETTAADSVAYEHPSESSLFEIPQGELSKIVTEIDRMNRVLAINPQNAFAWDTIGGLFKSVGQYEDAIQAYQNAISIDPQKVFYFFHLGLMYAAAGRYEDAIDVFKHVLEMDPNHGLAHATLGGYYRRQGMDDLADAHLDRARELLADQENEYNRACMEAISGNSDRALELLELALKNKQTQAGWVVRDPDLDYVRSDPRFYALLNEYASRPVN
jgi:tetratricopeptide (TPR) repeat protein